MARARRCSSHDVTVTGGELDTDSPTSAAGGMIEIVATDGVDMSVFDGSTNAVTIDGYVRVNEGANLELIGTIKNQGTIEVDSSFTFVEGGSSVILVDLFVNTNLIINGEVTLEGGGTVALDDYLDSITGASGGGTLINVDNTILGSGNIGGIGNDTLTFVNKADGVVDATGSMLLDTGDNPVTNEGLLEATRGGNLEIVGRVDNEGGAIAAHAFEYVTPPPSWILTILHIFTSEPFDAVVSLLDATIAGGALVTDDPFAACGGVIEVVAVDGANLSVFDGSSQAVTIDAYVLVDAGANLELIGTIHNEGTIEVDGTVLTTDLIIDGPVTLDDGGTIVLDGSTDQIVGAPGGGVLDNVDNIILGAGQIGTGDDNLTLINETAGVIDATGLLIVETGSNRIKNAGLFEATGGGALEIESRFHNSGKVLALAGSEVLFEANVHNGSDGRIVARGNEAQVEFADGHLRNDGIIVAEHNGTVLFDEGVTVTNKFDGVIKATHHGTVEFDDAIVVNKDGGEIVSIGCGSQVDFLGGSIGNDGLIVAKYDGMVLFDEGATVTNKSDGLIKATDGGTVKFDNAEVFNHHGGLIEAVGDGSTVDFCYSCVDNAGKIVSVGCNSEVDFRGGFLGNSGAVVADYDGTVLFDNATVINKHDGLIEATDGGTVKFDNTDVSNDQDAIIKAAGDGSTVDFCYSCVDNSRHDQGLARRHYLLRSHRRRQHLRRDCGDRLRSGGGSCRCVDLRRLFAYGVRRPDPDRLRHQHAR